MPAAAFGELFRDRPPIRLVVLNACEGARRFVDALAGVAPQLLQCGVPAVLAMQSRLTDSEASIFASTFYAELAHGSRSGNVEAALARARGALFGDRFPSPIFASPVLYLRTEDGELWRPEMGSRQAPASEALPAGKRVAGKRAPTAQGDAAEGPASLESKKGSAAADAARPPSRTDGPPPPPLSKGREGSHAQPMERLAPMTDIVHLVRVFIASPSDVKVERQTIREVIAEWNATHTEDRRIVLMPIDWETDAAPSMEDRPQGIVNRLLADADLLIAVFWTRLGRPTGMAVSGTVEEIERHIAAGKPAMLYFSRRRIRPEQLDSAQYQALTKFKEDTQRRGLVAEYGDLSDLRAKLVKHLSQKLNRASGLIPVTSSILAGPKIYDRLGYRREEIFGRVQRSLILAGPNLRDWLSDPLARHGLVNLIRERGEVTVTFVLGTLGMLRELHGEGEAHLKTSVVELDMMRSQLTTDQRQRMRCFFHWGAATLSAVFIDPESPSGVLFFTPRWGYDYNPRQRLTCMIEKRNNSDLFGFIYDPLLLLTQPSGTQLDEMLKLIHE